MSGASSVPPSKYSYPVHYCECKYEFEFEFEFEFESESESESESEFACKLRPSREVSEVLPRQALLYPIRGIYSNFLFLHLPPISPPIPSIRPQFMIPINS